MYVVTKREYKMWWVEQDMTSSDKLNGLDFVHEVARYTKKLIRPECVEREPHFIQHFEEVLLFIHHTSTKKQTPLL